MIKVKNSERRKVDPLLSLDIQFCNSQQIKTLKKSFCNAPQW